MTDWLLELRIKLAFRRFLRAPRPRQPAMWRQIVRLIAQRSPRQVEKMESRMGLQ